MGRRKIITQKEAELMAKNPAYAAVMFIIIGVAIIIFAVLMLESIKVIYILSLLAGTISILLGFFCMFSAVRDKKRRERRLATLSQANMEEIDMMSGRQFELFLLAFYSNNGYSARLTRATGDYGADIILTKETVTIVVQVKHSKNKIGISAVQEVIGAIRHYGAIKGWVVTNNYFTKPACELAADNYILLVDRDELSNQIVKYKNKTSTQQGVIYTSQETEKGDRLAGTKH